MLAKGTTRAEGKALQALLQRPCCPPYSYWQRLGDPSPSAGYTTSIRSSSITAERTRSVVPNRDITGTTGMSRPFRLNLRKLKGWDTCAPVSVALSPIHYQYLLLKLGIIVSRSFSPVDSYDYTGT